MTFYSCYANLPAAANYKGRKSLPGTCMLVQFEAVCRLGSLLGVLYCECECQPHIAVHATPRGRRYTHLSMYPYRARILVLPLSSNPVGRLCHSGGRIGGILTS